jgi:hypothetical protein
VRKLAAAFILGAALARPFGVLADVVEPTAPVLEFTLSVENYATGLHTDCLGSTVEAKIRVIPIATVQSLPSEHFTVVVVLEERQRNTKTGAFFWQLRSSTPWSHQNAGPNEATLKFNTAYSHIALLGIPAGGLTHILPPGYWRVRAVLVADQSGGVFDRTCEFTIA